MLQFITTNLRGNNIFIDNIIVQDANNSSLLESSKTQIFVHPNPSNGVFEFSFDQNSFIKNIYVYNSIGRQIINTIELNTYLNKYEIDLGKFNSGLYFISIENEEGEQTIKLIKK